jgi:hypothetical protein
MAIWHKRSKKWYEDARIYIPLCRENALDNKNYSNLNITAINKTVNCKNCLKKMEVK